MASTSFSFRSFCTSSRFNAPAAATNSTFQSKHLPFTPDHSHFLSENVRFSFSVNPHNVRAIWRTFEIAFSGNGCDGFPPGEPPRGGGGGGGGGGREGGDNGNEEEEFGPVMKFEDVIRKAEARGASLPSDMLDAAKSAGIRRLLLLRYLNLQSSPWPLGAATRSCSLLRDRMLADPSFLFKVGTEIVIDSCCATFAEIQKRGTISGRSLSCTPPIFW